MPKPRAPCFIKGFKHLETIKALLVLSSVSLKPLMKHLPSFLTYYINFVPHMLGVNLQWACLSACFVVKKQGKIKYDTEQHRVA